MLCEIMRCGANRLPCPRSAILVETAVILATSAPQHRTHLTRQMPRALLPALGRPIVIRVMDQLYRSGIRHFRVLVGIDEGGVAAYLNKWMPDATIAFVLQNQNESLPTMLSRLAQEEDRDFIIAGYNSCIPADFVPKLLKQHHTYPQTLTVTAAKSSLAQSAQQYYMLLDNHEIVQASQPATEHSAFLLTDHVVCGEPFRTFLASMSRAEAYRMGRNLLDVVAHYTQTVTPAITLCEADWILRLSDDRDLLTLNTHLLNDLNDAHILSELPYTVRIIPPVRIDPQVSVGQGATIGPYVYIERGSSIGYGASVKNALILERSSVPANADIDSSIITTRGTVHVER